MKATTRASSLASEARLILQLMTFLFISRLLKLRVIRINWSRWLSNYGLGPSPSSEVLEASVSPSSTAASTSTRRRTPASSSPGLCPEVRLLTYATEVVGSILPLLDNAATLCKVLCYDDDFESKLQVASQVVYHLWGRGFLAIAA